ncbi:MAG: GFA family protein [Gammaproteobacteria bacterium]|nr:GFA family protein [Gammaproteobacteria bacterium]
MDKADNSSQQTHFEGGCFCGEIRYRFEQPIITTVNCHCSMCRRTSGAPYVSWLVIPVEQFSYTLGQPKVLQSSTDGTRYFCHNCGTPVVCINATHPQWVDVTLGSLDDPEYFVPAQDVHDDTRLSWLAP